ncbi:hypothetical protein [Prosthecomicrobium hirschii]|uniref:Phosphate starvation-inducible protein PsiF n=1 Tax=Prosthecodimorpha hirschii TaxID=665126 RepID=A0A0P6VMC3_9HYPH|nr:hypothetical protein [Prosthecomicrobium hirschii]KPL51318.1 hypothetical protein ABB55_03005 [Prosthecomicrobium hirschii]MCW1838806.1 hypothetical protein [Prosthecomicrobium hirschii]
MTDRILAALIAGALAFTPAAAFAQATTTKPAATTETKPAAKPAASKAAAKADDEDEPSSAEQKKACDAKWKTEKEKTGAKGWKAYFTYMAKCM